MSRVNPSETYCNIARSLAIVGDRWTLLIMREVGLGVRRFEEIQAQTGMSSHLLANRLKRLEEEKLLERRVYNARPLRHEYFPTPKGKDLAPVSLALRNWDLRWGGSDGKGSAAAVLTDKRTGKLIDGNWNNPEDEVFSFDQSTSVISRAWKAERDARAAAFYAAKNRSAPKPEKVATKSVSKKTSSAKIAPKPSVRTKAMKKTASKKLATKKR